MENGYPLKFIFNVLRNRLKTLFYNINSNFNKDVQLDETERISYFTISYVPRISEKFKNIICKERLSQK